LHRRSREGGNPGILPNVLWLGPRLSGGEKKQAKFMLPIIITSGDQLGIGPEIALKAAQKKFKAPLFFFGDKNVFEKTACELNLNMPEHFENIPNEFDMLTRAATGCLSNKYSALVTCPVNKAKLNKQRAFTGHTEWLAQFCGVKKTVMCLANSQLSVALATTHLPLREVPNTITTELLEQTLCLIEKNYPAHEILVCGLNPHAGEEGLLGDEEIQIITPLIKKLNKPHISGPYPADTVFLKALNKNVVVLAMYHDQGLSVIKTLDFEHSVNITLGLPFVRTSVDHGTAYDLVGTGQASSASLEAAIKVAIDLHSCRPREVGGPDITLNLDLRLRGDDRGK